MSRSMGGARVLVVDDKPAILRAVQTNLARHDFRVETAETGRAALEALGRFLVLSIRGAERDKGQALDLDADDYRAKPFGVDELLARARVALRHAARPTQ